MSNSHSQRRGRVPFFFCSTNLKRRMINLGLEIGGRRTTEGRWMQIQRSIFIDYEKRKFLQLEKISSSQIILCSMPKKHARCLLERPVTRPDWENLTCHHTHEEAVLDAAGALSFVKSCMCREILVLHSSSWCTVAVQWWWEELAIVFSFLEQFVWRAAAIL